jgi:copper chaperone CopZ
MTHTYNITGMTCSSCVAKVKSELLKLGDVTSADVQLQSPQATISMTKHISTETLQKALSKAGAKYLITDADINMHHTSATIAEETTTSYFPIFLIFGYITGISLIIQFSNGRFDLMHWMNHFMAGFFFVFSFFKTMNLKGFAEGYSTYDVLAKKIPVYGFIYPFIELALGIAYLTEFNPIVTNAITVVVMGISTIGVVQSLMKKNPFQCACLGTVIKLPLSKVTLFEDLLMVGMSIVMLIMLNAG